MINIVILLLHDILLVMFLDGLFGVVQMNNLLHSVLSFIVYYLLIKVLSNNKHYNHLISEYLLHTVQSMAPNPIVRSGYDRPFFF